MTQTPDQYFDSLSWPYLFSVEIMKAARYHFQWLMLDGRMGKVEAAQRALSYAQGARWMKGETVKGEGNQKQNR